MAINCGGAVSTPFSVCEKMFSIGFNVHNLQPCLVPRVDSKWCLWFFLLWYNNFGVHNLLLLFLFQCKDSHGLIGVGESSQAAQAGAAYGSHIGTIDPDAFWYTIGTAGQGWQGLEDKKKNKRASTLIPSISQKVTNSSKVWKSNWELHNNFLKVKESNIHCWPILPKLIQQLETFEH